MESRGESDYFLPLAMPSMPESDESKYACPRLVANELHWPWSDGLPIPWGDDGPNYRETLRRPAFFRTHAIVSGVNSAARHVVGEETTPCPYCRDRFRNPAALRLHVEERHGADIEWLNFKGESVE